MTKSPAHSIKQSSKQSKRQAKQPAYDSITSGLAGPAHPEHDVPVSLPTDAQYISKKRTSPKPVSTNTRLAQLEAENASLKALMRVSKAIAGISNLDDLLDLIRSETQQALQAERCSVFLFDSDTNELWSRVATGIHEHESLRFPANSGLAGAVVQTGQVINVSDVYKDHRFNATIDQKTGFKTTSMLCVPMFGNQYNKLLGVFQVINKQSIDHAKGFNENDEELLQAIAGNAAVAIENAQLITDQKIAFESFITTLSSTIDARDPITAGHSQRVTDYTALIGQQLRLDDNSLECLKYASLLHDIGKIGIREEVLVKDGRLTLREYEHIQTHVAHTHNILKNIHFECHLRSIPEIAASHHEKIDGSGYYRGLKGDEIPIGGRILAIGDVFDAITSRRQYRNRMPFGRAMGLLLKNTGNQFDPACMEAFLKVPLHAIAEVLMVDTHVREQLRDIRRFSAARLTLGEFYPLLKKSQLSSAEKTIVVSFQDFYNKGII